MVWYSVIAHRSVKILEKNIVYFEDVTPFAMYWFCILLRPEVRSVS